MAKTRRLLELMQVIQTKEKFSVRELAEEFDVSYRTMLRDLQELSALGVPLYSETGKHGGYHLLRKPAFRPAAGSGKTDETKVVIKPAFRVIGMPYTAPITSFSAAEVLIGKMRERFVRRLHEIKDRKNEGVGYGIIRYEKSLFTYWYAVEVKRHVHVPEGMRALTIPTRQYAVFTHRGSVRRASLDETYWYAIRRLHKAGYEQDHHGYHLEVYDRKQLAEKTEAEVGIYLPLN